MFRTYSQLKPSFSKAFFNEDFALLRKASKEELEALNTIGPETASSILKFFKEQCLLLDELLKELVLVKAVQRNSLLQQKSFVITGSFSNRSRDELKEIIRSLGGEVKESVSKNLDYLIVGNNPGEKLRKAEKLGVKCLFGEDFFKLIGYEK